MTLDHALALIATHLEAVCQRCKPFGGAGKVQVALGEYETCPDCTNGKIYPFRKPCEVCDGKGVWQNGGDCPPCNGTGYLPLEAHQLADALWKAGWDVNIDYCFGAGITAIVNKLGYGDSSSSEAHGTDAYYALALVTLRVLKINIHAS